MPSPPDPSILGNIFKVDIVEQRNIILNRASNGEIVNEACSWIQDKEEYRKWLDSGSRTVLWIRGGPGKGKTFMSIYITNHLEKRVKNSGSGLTTWYFFDSESNSNNTAEAALQSMVWSVCTNHSDLGKVLAKHYQHRGDDGNSLTFEFWWNVFVEVFKTFAEQRNETTYCVLDGLDKCEAESRRKLLDKVGALSKARDSDERSLPRFKLLIASQARHEMNTPLSEVPCLDLDGQSLPSVLAGIENFIKKKTEGMKRIGNWSESFLEKAQDTFKCKTKNDYLWTAFISRQIEAAGCSEDSATTALEAASVSGPEGLRSLYDEMLLRIDNMSKKKQFAKKILRTVLCARRPLTLGELGSILLKKKSAKSISTLAREMEEKIRSHGCDEMLVIEALEQDVDTKKCPPLPSDGTARERHHSDPQEESCLATKTVTFFHPTTLRLFLEEKFKESLPGEHAVLCKVAFASVFHWAKHPHDCEKGGAGVSKNEPLECTLLDYSIRYWPEHFRLAREIDVETILTIVDKTNSTSFWVEDSRERDRWLQEYWRRIMPYWHCPMHFQAIHFAAFFGMDWLVDHYLGGTNKFNIHKTANMPTDYGMMPLHWASRNGHESIVRKLLNVHNNVRKIDLDGEGYKMTPLLWAVQNDHKDIAELLLEHGANSEARVFGKTPLHWAVSDGNMPLTRLLLENKASTDARVDIPKTSAAFAIRGTMTSAAVVWSGASFKRAQNESRADMETRSGYLEGKLRAETAQRWTVLNATVLFVLTCSSIIYWTCGKWPAVRPFLLVLGWELWEVGFAASATGLLWFWVVILYKLKLKALAATFAIMISATWAGFLSGLAIMLIAATVCCIPDEMAAMTLKVVPEVMGQWKSHFATVCCILITARVWQIGLRTWLHITTVALLVASIFGLIWASVPGVLIFIALASNGEIGIKEWGILSIPFIGFAVLAFVGLIAHLVAYGDGASFVERLKVYFPALLLATSASSLLVWLKPIPHIGSSQIGRITVALLGGIWSSIGVGMSISIVELVLRVPQLVEWWQSTFWNSIHGHTPLLIAVQNGFEDIAQELLDHGADIDAKDARGDSAEQLARTYGKIHLAEMIEKRKKTKQNSISANGFVVN